MLELRRYDPTGQKFGPEGYVFGNEVGEQLKNYQKAWSTLRLRRQWTWAALGLERQVPALLP